MRTKTDQRGYRYTKLILVIYWLWRLAAAQG